MKDLKTILQTASSGRPINPYLVQGGTDKVIYYLDREFSRKGHNSLVAGTGDSEIAGKLVETIPYSYDLWKMEGENSSGRNSRYLYNLYSKQHYKKIFDFISENKDIDIIHDHPGKGILSRKESSDILKKVQTPILITLHSNFSGKYMERSLRWKKLSSEKKDIYFNAISRSQREEFERGGLNIDSVIYHGIPLQEFDFSSKKSNYLFSLGRVCPKKGQHIAIKTAKRTGIPLIMGGVVNSMHHDYWKEKIAPYLDFSISDIPYSERQNYKEDLIGKLEKGEDIIDKREVIFIGDLDDRQKSKIYEKARGFLMPVNWSEPFGLTMIEAMACGTPVLSYSKGSIPEIIEEGKTGFSVKRTGVESKDVESLSEIVCKIENIKSRDCRRHVQKNFSLEREAENYLNLYKKIIND